MGFTKKSIFRGGGGGQFADLRGGLGKKDGGVFEEGVDTPIHTMKEPTSRHMEGSL